MAKQKIISIQSSDNAKVISVLAKDADAFFVSKEAFKGKRKGHKFHKGQKARLCGLEDYPEFNGEIIEITNIRQDGEFGRAYYFKTTNSMLAKQLNWVYEYRLANI